MGRGLCYKFAVFVVLPLLAVISYYVVDQPQYFGPIVIDGSEINFSRNADGVMTFEGKDIRDFARGLGYAHAHDRLVQMTLQKKISLGRLTDDVAVSEQSKRVDKLFRQLNFAKRASRSVSLMTEEEKQYYVDYCNGFNHYIDTMWIPPVEYLLGRNLKPEHWTPEDCAMTFQLVAYVGLSSLQTDIEKVIIEVMAATHLPNDKIQSLLADLFPKQTTTLDDELISYIRQLKEYKPYLNAEIVSDLRVLDTLGSNNWVVSGEHTRSGFPLQANDPHLQVDRLPTVFYEFIFYQKENGSRQYASGISAPGFPGLIMGRTNDVSYGLTYGFMDQVDYFIEHVVDGKVQRPNNVSIPLLLRTENLTVEKGEILTHYIFETEDGVQLELVNNYTSAKSIPDGYYLSWKWAWDHLVPKHINGLRFEFFPDAPSAAAVLRNSPSSCNFMIADRKGNIAYQQSGLLPKRNPTINPILPALAWKEGAVWTSLRDATELIHLLNPPEGYIVSANNDVQLFDPSVTIPIVTAHVGPYRHARASEIIQDAINNNEKLTVKHMKQMQLDLYSKRAEIILPILIEQIEYIRSSSDSEALADSQQVIKELVDWDKRYTSENRGGLIFELLYVRILGEVLGAGFFEGNGQLGNYYLKNTTMQIILFHYLDAVFIENKENSVWFENESRDDLIRRVIKQFFTPTPDKSVKANRERTFVYNKENTYGKVLMPIIYKNIFFMGKLPLWLGFDVGPFIQTGNAAVLCMGDHRNKHGESPINSGAAWRYVTDMGEDITHTISHGGPSGRRLSQYYTSDLARYVNNQYKTITH